MSTISTTSSRDLSPRWRLLLLGSILLIGFGLRCWRLDSIPPGMWFDEALNGQDAVNVWKPGGGLKLVYPDVFPREPLYETLLAFTVRLAGPRVVALRMVSVSVGTLTLLLLYLMLRREAGEATALTAAAVLATMRWHVIFSRLIFRTLILPAWITGLVWAALAVRRRPTAGRAIALGVMVGGGFYTYLAWYFMLPLVLGLVAWLAAREWNAPGGRRRLGLVLAAAVLTFLPIGIHYLRFPSDLLARPGAVSVFANGYVTGAREILKNIGDALLMFHWRGDHVPVQNIPWRPALEPIQGILFVYGLVLAIGQAFRRRRLPLILLGWLACGLSATVFTHTDSPNFLRTLCVTPAVATLTAMGVVDLGRRLGKGRSGSRQVAFAAALTACWAASCVLDLTAWAGRVDVWERFHGPLTQIANYARVGSIRMISFMCPSRWSSRAHSSSR